MISIMRIPAGSGKALQVSMQKHSTSGFVPVFGLLLFTGCGAGQSQSQSQSQRTDQNQSQAQSQDQRPILLVGGLGCEPPCSLSAERHEPAAVRDSTSGPNPAARSSAPTAALPACASFQPIEIEQRETARELVARFRSEMVQLLRDAAACASSLSGPENATARGDVYDLAGWTIATAHGALPAEIERRVEGDPETRTVVQREFDAELSERFASLAREPYCRAAREYLSAAEVSARANEQLAAYGPEFAQSCTQAMNLEPAPR